MTSLKVLMFGWEFPPHSIGGLGKVTYYLTSALADQGIKISLILPVRGHSDKMNILPTNMISIKEIRTLLSPYMTDRTYSQNYLMEESEARVYGSNLREEIDRFTTRGVALARGEDFDVIHCHDWMTFLAGMLTKDFSGKPLILHVHTTELDRSCGGCNPYVYDIEYKAFQKADRIIAVSQYTKNIIVQGYGIRGDKIEVVHNATNFNGERKGQPSNRKKVVLYFGRLSMHKGPDYFIRAAKKVLDYDKGILFVVAGSGELLPEMIDLACSLNIGDKILFTGRLTDEEVKEIYAKADVYVMPSVSEPFGITALEAISQGTPLIVSNNAGVKEVLSGCFTVDFWDTDEIANKILSVLKYHPVRGELTENAYRDLERLSWNTQAAKVKEIYNSLL